MDIQKQGDVYRLIDIPIKSEVCKVDRFLNQTNRNVMLAIDTMFFCPDSNFSFELSGTISGDKAKMIAFYVEPCN